MTEPDATTSGPFTLVIKCLWDGTTHASQYFWLRNYWWAIYVNSPPGAGGLNFVRNWSTNYDAVSSSTFFTDGVHVNKWIHFVWVSPGAGTNLHYLYENGVPKQGTRKSMAAAASACDGLCSRTVAVRRALTAAAQPMAAAVAKRAVHAISAAVGFAATISRGVRQVLDAAIGFVVGFLPRGVRLGAVFRIAAESRAFKVVRESRLWQIAREAARSV